MVQSLNEGPRRQRRILALASTILISLAACVSGPQAADERTWEAPWPPDEFASGLVLSCVPAGYEFVESEGHESAVFHNFSSADHAHLAIGRTTVAEAKQTTGEVVVVDGRNFHVLDNGKRLAEMVDPTTRVEVVASDLPLEILSDVARCLHYDAALDVSSP